ncbi:hypothetical protein Tco_0322971 [Tanacetum coccineum]
MVQMVRTKAFVCSCGKGDVVLRQSYKRESYECSNCKYLRGKISVLKAAVDMHMHPEHHTVDSTALLHEVLNEMEKLDLE